MLETPGRKLFRSPFPRSRPTLPPDSSPDKVHALHSPKSDSVIADAETREMNSLVSSSSRSTAIADVETLEIPSQTQSSSRKSAIADVETFKFFSFPFFPSYALSPTDVQRRNEQTQVSQQKKILLLMLIIVLLVPTFLTVFEIINTFVIYSQIQGGITHLQNAITIFHGSSNGVSGAEHYFDRGKLLQAREEIDAAHTDFASLSDKLEHDGTISLLSYFLPAQVSTIRSLSQIASDGTASLKILVRTAIDISPSIASAIQQGQTQTETTQLRPYLTPSSFEEVVNALYAIEPLIHDMNIIARGLSLNSLPFTDRQRQMLESALPLLPTLDTVLSHEHEWSDSLRWILGIDQQRSFLIEPMDSAELRANGGFTGQFGDLVSNGAHVGQLHLENLGKYEEDHTSEGSPPDTAVYQKVVGQNAPTPYSEWWPIANFGLRDANLSADFPTSASIAINRYAYEFGIQADGVIMFTPTLIEHILSVTGPILIPGYNEKISAQNLQQRLHYYQLDNMGIRHEGLVEHVEDPQIARKLFTQRVTTTLISTVTHLPLNKLLPMASEMLRSMKSKDLQVYATNPQIESLIGKYGSTASLDRSNTHDGLFIVQSNLSANKASQYVTTQIHDIIALDASGGATHHLQLKLDYQQKGDVFGFDTYYDFIRVYVPINSQLIAGDGFDQYNRPYCGDAESTYRLCQPDVYGNGALVCVQPITLGLATSYLNDPYAGTDHPLDMIGPPQNLQSDEAERGMFGGWVVVPKNCTMTVTLSWYVPPMNQYAYNLLLQAQAEVFAPLDLTIQPDQKICVPDQKNSLHFSSVMNGEDMNFTVEHKDSKCVLNSQ